MLYLVLGSLALLAVLWGRDRKPVFKRREWRLMSGAFAVAAFAGATFAIIRSEWVIGAMLLMMGLWLASTTRGPILKTTQSRTATRMGVSEACSILGVEEGASPAEIKAAYTRLMRLAHPDKGGTSGLAAQLNAARDRLLGP